MQLVIVWLTDGKGEEKEEQKCCCENVEFHDGLVFFCLDSDVVVIGLSNSPTLIDVFCSVVKVYYVLNVISDLFWLGKRMICDEWTKSITFFAKPAYLYIILKHYGRLS